MNVLMSIIGLLYDSGEQLLLRIFVMLDYWSDSLLHNYISDNNTSPLLHIDQNINHLLW